VNAWAADAANRQTAATTGKAAKAFFMTFTVVRETTESHRENPVFNGQKQDKGRISFAATIMPRRGSFLGPLGSLRAAFSFWNQPVRYRGRKLDQKSIRLPEAARVRVAPGTSPFHNGASIFPIRKRVSAKVLSYRE
jgi:hypothetical protein